MHDMRSCHQLYSAILRYCSGSNVVHLTGTLMLLVVPKTTFPCLPASSCLFTHPVLFSPAFPSYLAPDVLPFLLSCRSLMWFLACRTIEGLLFMPRLECSTDQHALYCMSNRPDPMQKTAAAGVFRSQPHVVATTHALLQCKFSYLSADFPIGMPCCAAAGRSQELEVSSSQGLSRLCEVADNSPLQEIG